MEVYLYIYPIKTKQQQQQNNHFICCTWLNVLVHTSIAMFSSNTKVAQCLLLSAYTIIV